jgi:protein TonB
MTNTEILQADILDILFEKRNKSYGAYTLRKEYNHRLGYALGITLALAGSLILFPFHENNNNSNYVNIGLADSVVLKTYDFEPEQNRPKEKQQDNFKREKSVSNIQIVPDNDETDIPDQADISDAIISNEKVKGTALIDPNLIITNNAENSQPKFPEINTPEVDFVPKEIPPSFPGGITAWLNFLRKYLQAPEGLEAGQKVEVRVKFWIDKEGVLSKFEIVQSGGNLFDKEVLRVMKKMPDWIPASQNNYRIAVAYTQPVIFMGVEE